MRTLHDHTIFPLAVALLMLGLAAEPADASVYYVAANGSDLNDGLSIARPWQTIAKVNAVSFAAGDAIRFRAGDTFFGQITVTQQGLEFGAYGTDAKPVITGGIELTGWTQYQGAIYRTVAGAFVKDLFANGVQMTLARYPNAGLAAVGATNGSTWISSPDVLKSAGSWTGGNIRIRTRDWAYETRRVAAQNGSMLVLSGEPEFSYGEGWGFYLDNTLQALDAPGEWYCDPVTNVVYFYAPGGVHPSSVRVDGVVGEYGIRISASGTTVTGLAFRYQAAAAVHAEGAADNVQILGNDIYGQWMHGIEFIGRHAHCTIDGNTIRLVNGRGINANAPDHFTITNNTVKQIGLIPGYGSSGFTGLTAIYAQAGTHNIISGNVIDSIGYIGIRHDGSDNLIERNVISNTMLRLADGGAIYAWGGTGGTYGTMIRKNIIENVPGDNTGVPNEPNMKQGYGIYFDLGCFNMSMEDNTIIHAGDAAVFVQYADRGIVIRNNTFYECAVNPHSATLELIQHNLKTHGGHIITNNMFIPLDNKSPLIRLQQYDAMTVLEPFGTIDSNYYYDPYKRVSLFHLLRNAGPCNTYAFTFSQWKDTLRLDASSALLTSRVAIPATRDPSVMHALWKR